MFTIREVPLTKQAKELNEQYKQAMMGDRFMDETEEV